MNLKSAFELSFDVVRINIVEKYVHHPSSVLNVFLTRDDAKHPVTSRTSLLTIYSGLMFPHSLFNTLFYYFTS